MTASVKSELTCRPVPNPNTEELLYLCPCCANLLSKMRAKRFSFLISLLLLSACGGFAPEPIWQKDSPQSETQNDQTPANPPSGPVKPTPTEFETGYKDIRAKVFQPFCLKCHNTNNREGGVDLSSLTVMLGQSGLLVPGQPSQSLVYRVVEAGQMPPRGGGLSVSARESLRLWIESGNSNQ